MKTTFLKRAALISITLFVTACGASDHRQDGVSSLREKILSLQERGGQRDFEATADYLIGGGKGDITGPASGLSTAGYAAPAPKTAGIHQRLWARGFVLAERGAPEQRVALVTADLCYITGIVKDAVIKSLQERHGTLYRHDNVLIAATHTHSGPGGFSQHGMYNTPSSGFSQENFDAIVAGIVAAIEEANANLQPGALEINTGRLQGAGRNRSKIAFDQNSSVLKSELPNAVDESVTMLTFIGQDGPIGIQHWFATHGTSLDKSNALISGDNKGYAAWRFESWMREAAGMMSFIAAFANSNAGDASPNTAGDVDRDGTWECAANENFACMRESGEKQFTSAQQLFNAQGNTVGTGIRSLLRFVDMSKVTLTPAETGMTKNVSTCDPAIGVSMLAGSAEDGPGIGQEGVTCENAGPVMRLRCQAARFACHGAKPVVIPTEDLGRYGFTAHIVPVQLITIGKLALAGVPAEMTSMAGHLLKKSLSEDLAIQGIERVVIAAYANEYTNYVTTRDEYQVQHYEGASTLFGEWTLAAYQKIYRELARDIATATGFSSGSMPVYSTDGLPVANQRRGTDRTPIGGTFGSVVKNAKLRYKVGQTVSVTFQASNLNNSLGRKEPFFMIEKQEGQAWKKVLDDDHFYTKLKWNEVGAFQSQATVEWQIQTGTAPGNYRITYQGTSVSILQRSGDFQGTSSVFTVEQ